VSEPGLRSLFKKFKTEIVASKTPEFLGNHQCNSYIRGQILLLTTTERDYIRCVCVCVMILQHRTYEKTFGQKLENKKRNSSFDTVVRRAGKSEGLGSAAVTTRRSFWICWQSQLAGRDGPGRFWPTVL